MRLSQISQFPRRFYTELDYARHMPRTYVDRAKRQVSLRDFDNRFGAPMLQRWKLPPDEHIDLPKRPWESDYASASFVRSRQYQASLHRNKIFRTRHREFTPQAPSEWIIFPGDTVQVMVGRDRGKQGIVSHVIREHNAVFVDNLHVKLVQQKNPYAAAKGVPEFHQYEMQPLDPTKGQVMLVDPNDNDVCEAHWKQSVEDNNQFVRISARTGYRIPLPSQAYVTYEYVDRSKYIESPKDTPSAAVLRSTYDPLKSLKTFEQELRDDYGLKDTGVERPTYWY